MTWTDRFGIAHPSMGDEVTAEGLRHIDTCRACQLGKLPQSDLAPHMGIVEFLEARIAEDESEADAAALRDSYFYGAESAKRRQNRALAECAAKRAIILDHAEMVKAIEYLSAALPGNLNQDPDSPWRTAPYRYLASVYKDHPDYDAHWAL